MLNGCDRCLNSTEGHSESSERPNTCLLDFNTHPYHSRLEDQASQKHTQPLEFWDRSKYCISSKLLDENPATGHRPHSKWLEGRTKLPEFLKGPGKSRAWTGSSAQGAECLLWRWVTASLLQPDTRQKTQSQSPVPCGRSVRSHNVSTVREHRVIETGTQCFLFLTQSRASVH